MTALVLAHSDQKELMGVAYSALVGVPGYRLEGLCETKEALRQANVRPGDVLVIDVTLAGSVDEAVDLISSFGSVRVILIVPPTWKSQLPRFDDIDVLATFTSPVDWPAVATELKRHSRPPDERAEARTAEAPQRAASSTSEPGREYEPDPPSQIEWAGILSRRTCAVWGGHCGGTGRTTMALSLGIVAAERGVDVSLVGLSEPGLSTYLRLNRIPNVVDFADGERRRQDLLRVERPVVWTDDGDPPVLRVLLGPARPLEGKLNRTQIGEVIESVRAAHALVLLDLPPLVPGGNRWGLEPLNHVTDVVLVIPPTKVGVVATVESLATLRDLEVAPAVHVVLNRRLPGGLTVREFSAGVEEVWGMCPTIVAEVPFLPELPALIDKGDLPDLVLGDTPLAKAVLVCGEAAVGLPRPESEEEAREAGAPARGATEDRAAGGRKRRFSKLLTLEVID
jgi:MinD-like ATPase involved in chromosome partitioning or flagellar assembly